MDESTEVSEETAPSRYFRGKSADESPSRGSARKAAERPKARLDEEALPVDGDYEKLARENEDPSYVYFWASEFDLSRLRRPWVAEKWGPNCCRPKWHFGDMPEGQTIKIDGLTMMKMPKRLWAEIQKRDPKRSKHRILRKQLFDFARQNGRAEETQAVMGTTDLDAGSSNDDDNE